MLSNSVHDYLKSELRRLSKRKTYKKRWVPTNGKLKAIITTLAEGDAPLLKIFYYHNVDLIEVAGAVYWALRRQGQIDDVLSSLRSDKDAERKHQQRVKKSPPTETDLHLTLKDRRRFLFRYDRRRRVAQHERRLEHLNRYYPNFLISNRKKATGRRQDLPMKIVHSELANFFAQAYSHVVSSQRREWIYRIITAMLPDPPTRKAFQKQTSRLRKQVPSCTDRL